MKNQRFPHISLVNDEADAKARALAIGKELMHAEEPEKETEDEYGAIENDEID